MKQGPRNWQRADLARQKVKLGKEFDNYVVDEADWVGGYCL